MCNVKRLIVPAMILAGAMVAAGTSAQAGCITKAGSGTGGDRSSAQFQAWEAVLQATSWGSWAGFMGSGMKVGTAPGYRVSGVRTSCRAGGLGQTCVMQATLCN